MTDPIIFSGTAYLGLDRHPAFLALVREGLERWGAHYGGSRRSPLCPEVFATVETALAAWTGAPAALLVGSGTAAGQLVARFLAERALALHAGPMTHPALWWPQGTRHATWAELLAAARPSETAVFTDALDPLRLRVPPWAELLAARPAVLVVDDSHPIGCYGPRAAGSWPVLSTRYRGELIVTASLGKALSLPAGVILGEADTLAAIRAMPQFGGASPPPPAFLHAWLHGAAIIAAQRERLARNMRRLHPLIKSTPGFSHRDDFPVYTLSRRAWVEPLERAGIVLSSFHYPDARSPRYDRIVLRADHTEAEIERLIEAIERVADI